MSSSPALPPQARALFLDRDGVINHDHGYLHQKEDFQFLEGIFDLCQLAHAHGLQIHVVTNQSGIGRGYYTEDDFHALSAWMTQQFAAQGIPIAGVHFCPHHPRHGQGIYRQDSPRRKPAPGMILDAAREHGLDVARSVMVGDKATDMQAAQAAGVGRWILVSHDQAEQKASPAGTHGVTSLAQARQSLLQALKAL